jgi:hypothetical protein
VGVLSGNESSIYSSNWVGWKIGVSSFVHGIHKICGIFRGKFILFSNVCLQRMQPELNKFGEVLNLFRNLIYIQPALVLFVLFWYFKKKPEEYKKMLHRG